MVGEVGADPTMSKRTRILQTRAVADLLLSHMVGREGFEPSDYGFLVEDLRIELRPHY